VLFQQDRAVAVHGSQGGAQVVGDRIGEGLQVLVGLLQLVGPLLVGDILLQCVAALVVAAGVEGLLGVPTFAVLGRLDLVLGLAGAAALGISLHVDLVLDLTGVTALGISLHVDLVLDLTGVTALGISLHVDLVLDLAGVTALGISLHVDLVLDLAGVTALGISLHVDLVLDLAGVTALGIGPHVDLVLDLTGAAALDIGPVLGMAGVAALVVDCAGGLLRVLLKRFADLTIAAVASSRRPDRSCPLAFWFPGHVRSFPSRRRKV
jgi:hypothetical protein